MKLLRFPTLFLLLIVTNPLLAQNLTGTWIGSYSNLPSRMMPPQKVMIEITVYNDSLITGVSHLYYTKGRFEHHKMSGKFNRRDGTVILSEDSILSKKSGPFISIHEGVYTLKLSISGSRYVMRGQWKDQKGGLFKAPTIDIQFLKKIEPFPVPDLTKAETNTLPPVASRVTDIQQLIEVEPHESDSIRVDVVDNGVVDGDTVSIYLDNRVIAQLFGISEKPLSFSFSLDRSQPIQKIKMVAENMGSIPPNTALFIITIGKKKHNVYLSSDMQKNATVEFFLK